MTGNSSLILPYSVNLSIYGIAGINPGNIFKIDYLPKVYQHKVVFVTETVTHELTQGHWTTNISAYMMYRGDRLFLGNVEPVSPILVWNPRLLWKMGYSKAVIMEVLENPDIPWWTVDTDAVAEVKKLSTAITTSKEETKKVIYKVKEERKSALTGEIDNGNFVHGQGNSINKNYGK